MVPPALHRVFTACGIRDASATIEGSRNPVEVVKCAIQMLHGGVSLLSYTKPAWAGRRDASCPCPCPYPCRLFPLPLSSGKDETRGTPDESRAAQMPVARVVNACQCFKSPKSRVLILQSNPPGFGSGLGGKGRREDKGRGMKSRDEIERERGRYGVDIGRRI